MANSTASKRVKNVCVVAAGTAIIAVLSQISIPMPGGVPMTLQTFALPLVAAMLGWKKGTLSAIIYLLLGAVGAPVFAGFSGGFQSLIGPTGGFLLGFPLMAFCAGMGAHKNWARRALWLVLGVIADYSCGVIVFMIVTGSGLVAALNTCVWVFLPLEAIKQACVWALAPKLGQALEKSGVLN